MRFSREALIYIVQKTNIKLQKYLECFGESSTNLTDRHLRQQILNIADLKLENWYRPSRWA